MDVNSNFGTERQGFYVKRLSDAQDASLARCHLTKKSSVSGFTSFKVNFEGSRDKNHDTLSKNLLIATCIEMVTIDDFRSPENLAKGIFIIAQSHTKREPL
jgi:hypothetical protein